MEASNAERMIQLHYNQIITGLLGVYIIKDFLGSGTYGQVVKAIKQDTGEVVAIKFIHAVNSQSAIGEASMLKILREFDAEQNSLIKLIDHFILGNSFCLVFEMLDVDLSNFLYKMNGILEISDIRVIARDLLVALSLLNTAGVTHADIKPDNVMLVDHQSQPFRVKLIDFGLALKTHDLWRYETIQACGFRAPEVFLGLRKHEGIDTWAVACTLAFLFLGEFLHEINCEYNCMRQIFKLHGLPDRSSLEKGSKVDRFFIFDKSAQTWRFKTPEEYIETGNQILMQERTHRELDSMDDMLKLVPGLQDPYKYEDVKAFIDLLKRMLTVDPAERITPDEALNHCFITMSHLPRASNSQYVKSALERMNVHQIKEGETTNMSPDLIGTRDADITSNILDFSPSDYDLSDSDLSESEDLDSDFSDSGLSDVDFSDSDLSDFDSDEEADEKTSKSDFEQHRSQEEITSGNQSINYCRKSPNPAHRMSPGVVPNPDLIRTDNRLEASGSAGEMSANENVKMGMFRARLTSSLSPELGELPNARVKSENFESSIVDKSDEPTPVSDCQQDQSNQENNTDTNDQSNLSSFQLQPGAVITGNLGVYVVQSLLGSGAYGEVVECITQGTGEVVAVKLIHKEDHISATNEARALTLLREIDVDKNNLIKLIEVFELEDKFCFVLEMLDMALHELLITKDLDSLDIHAIRVIAQNLLVALSALKTLGIIHADIKPNNIMLVNHESQPFRVKLIDFGMAMKTQDSQQCENIQVVGFRAPEVFLGLPVDESVDIWAVACVLAGMFLGQFLHEPNCKYNCMRQIFKLHGLPDKSLLEKGSKVNHFFKFDESEQTWRFKTPEEYVETGNQITMPDRVCERLDSMDEILEMDSGIQDPYEYEDLEAFTDLLNRMLTVDPAERITPEEALSHCFITMSHLPHASNSSYVKLAHECMNVCQIKE